MTDENLAAGAMSGGIDLSATDGALHVSHITAMAYEIEARIDLHIIETASHWLVDAKSALRSALQYVEQHFAEGEAKAKAEIEGVEDASKTDVAKVEWRARGADLRTRGGRRRHRHARQPRRLRGG
ncbi:hypothetical protein [Bradyrhizobium sp. CCBAU 45384]|uniref:hypothetical protein n=1 Tax=Bradyrhizobium sp. CCBAU 45384 TaxID=858428 RepID=UPI0023050B47|nr:hypothetical protein [Bradyrhizobium sp. CCBAU 45384]MDA9411880.1 hypothetical protein [Bradyrhizobium sp. CCBAU 45384]